MSLTNDQITAQNFSDFYNKISPYLGIAHAGFTPVGALVIMTGNEVPANHLACDGTVYNISAYPELAAYYARSQGACNFYGGDGTTTFAVPDLRGEFIRGTGTNSHEGQGSGANVGVHQDATLIPEAYADGTTVAVSKFQPTNYDKKSALSPSSNSRLKINNVSSNDEWGGKIAIRTTNTSFLICVAAKNIFNDVGNNYSLEEQEVGTWIDGKPLYEKTIVTDKPAYTNGHCRVNIGASIDVVAKEHHEMISPDGVANACNCLRSIDSGTVNHKVTVFTNTNQYHPNTIDYVSCSDMTSYTAQYTMYSTIQYTKTTS